MANAEATNLVVPVGVMGGAGDPNRVLMETRKSRPVRTLLPPAAAGSANAGSLKALRADPSTQT